jgi:ribosomal protein S18 acetylase RimI-like enzyme
MVRRRHRLGTETLFRDHLTLDAVTVRVLTRADAATFRALRLRALKEYTDAFTSSFEEDAQKPLAATEQRISGQDGNVFWGAFVEGRLQGIVGLTREPRAKARHKGDVVAMYVAPESGRRGLGRALLQALIDHARNVAGLEQLVLTVTRNNHAAVELYRTTGFATFGVEPRAIKVAGEYFDKEHMILFL